MSSGYSTYNPETGRYESTLPSWTIHTDPRPRATPMTDRAKKTARKAAAAKPDVSTHTKPPENKS